MRLFYIIFYKDTCFNSLAENAGGQKNIDMPINKGKNHIFLY